MPDYYARFPKPCVGGWGRRSLNVTPAGKVLPCHAAELESNSEFWSVREHSLADIWANSPAFNAFRGTAWMQEPCASCARREIDFGGCRCQAFALTGDARATDPGRHLAPRHEDVAALAAVQTTRPTPTGGCEFRRLRHATVLANIDGNRSHCRAYTDRPVPILRYHPLFPRVVRQRRIRASFDLCRLSTVKGLVVSRGPILTVIRQVEMTTSDLVEAGSRHGEQQANPVTAAESVPHQNRDQRLARP